MSIDIVHLPDDLGYEPATLIVALFMCCFTHMSRLCFNRSKRRQQSASGCEQAVPRGRIRGRDQSPPRSPLKTTPPRQRQLAFGKSYTWDDGVTLTVSKPAKFKPGEYSKVKGAKAYRKFSVTVVNKSDQAIDLTLTYISIP